MNQWFQPSVASVDRTGRAADLYAQFLLSLATGMPLWVRSMRLDGGDAEGYCQTN